MMNSEITTDYVRAIDRQLRGVAPDSRDEAAWRAFGLSPVMMHKGMEGSAGLPDAPDDVLDKYAAQCGNRPTPVSAFVVLCKFVNGMNRKNIERNARLDALENENVALKAHIAGLETKMANRVTGVTWAGPYSSGATYRSGELCQKNGLWLCIAKETTVAPGLDPAAWKLVVHRRLVPTKTDDE